MAEELLRSKHAFGALENVLSAISSGKVDAYDVLFLKDKNGKSYIGWVDKDNQPVILEDEKEIIEVPTLPSAGETGKIYIYGSDGYFWNGKEFINLCKPTDVSVLENELTKLKADVEAMNSELAKKVDAKEVESKLDELASEIDDFKKNYKEVEYEISHCPEHVLVDYRDKEIRVMCPIDTKYAFQNSGVGADANSYYIGFKAYAPNNDVVSFKEDLTEIITDNTMYYFENNEFAGIDSNGRKYSIVWLPVAVFDGTKWTYHGEKSSTSKYIGWYYSVEWYGSDGKIVKSDCIRINLTNETCHSSIEPFYISHANAEVDTKIEESVTESKLYTDAQVSAAIAEACAIIEF